MKEKANTIEFINDIADEVLAEIIALEKILFPEPLQTEPERIKEIIMNPETISVIAYCDRGKVAGYIASRHHHEAYEDLKDADTSFSLEPGALYLEAIAIRPDLQGKGYFGKLMTKFLEGVGGKPITMHARVVNNCSLGMQKYGARFERSVEDWQGSGESFDYLVIPGRSES